MRTVDPVKHEAKRRQILDAAAVCFAEKGFEQTRTAEIAQRAGISSGSLFHYFPSKRAIFAAIFETETRDMAALVAHALESDDPWSQVRRLVADLLEPATQPQYNGLALEVAAHAARDVEFGDVVARNDRAVRAALAALIERAAVQGQIDPGVAPAAAAVWVSALIDMMFFRAGDDDFDPAEQVPMFWLLLERFLRPRAS